MSVELIANEVLDRHPARPGVPARSRSMEPDELAKELGRESLRYLYRILFLLYAEARPELGVLPVDDPEYVEGYSLARLGDLSPAGSAPSRRGTASTCTSRWTCSSGWSTRATGPRGSEDVEREGQRGRGPAVRAAALRPVPAGEDQAHRPA